MEIRIRPVKHLYKIMLIAVICLSAANGCKKSQPSPPPSAQQSGEAMLRLKSLFSLWQKNISEYRISPRKIKHSWEKFYQIAFHEYRQWMGSAEFFISAADRQLAAGNTDQAIEYFRQAVELAPQNIDAIKGLANALMVAQPSDEKLKLKYFQEALQLHQKIIDGNPDDLTSQYNKATALMKMGRLSEAESLYEQILKKQPDYVEARYNLATIYLSNSNLGYARDELKQVIKLAPHLPSAHAALGTVCMRLEQYDDAIACFAAARDLDEKNVSRWTDLAVAFKAVGKFGNAIYAYKKAIELAPADSEIYTTMGNTYLELHRATNDPKMLANAVEVWRKSLSLNKDQPEIKELVDLYSAVIPETTEPTSQPER